jgi:hypothetical protein
LGVELDGGSAKDNAFGPHNAASQAAGRGAAVYSCRSSPAGATNAMTRFAKLRHVAGTAKSKGMTPG